MLNIPKILEYDYKVGHNLYIQNLIKDVKGSDIMRTIR